MPQHRLLIDKLKDSAALTHDELKALVSGCSPEDAAYAAQTALAIKRERFGDDVYIRGLIEISNYCKNDCIYCGIRRSNRRVERYRLTPEQILECCEEGYELGFRTFVMQGGEDGRFTDELLCELLRRIKARFPECAVTLSLGERSRESYQALFNAGADRYLLRHETADAEHYSRLHPPELTLKRRMECLADLKAIGFQTGTGFMVGSPFQTPDCLARDLAYIAELRPQMIGIGPFIPHCDTEFAHEPSGSVDMSVYLVSILRIMLPSALIPATTALGTLDDTGREKALLAGANVIMPNLSPRSVRAKYQLYNGKLATGSEAAESLNEIRSRLAAIGCTIPISRGDHPGI